VIINRNSVNNSDTIKVSLTNNKHSRNSQNYQPGQWLWFGLGVAGIALLSAATGALLAVSLTSKPLMQTSLSADEAAVFDGNRISGSGLGFSELTRPVNILVMGMSVLTSDVRYSSEKTQKLGYLSQLNSFDGLADVILLLRFDPQNKKLVVLSIPRDTRVLIEGYGMKKINSANREGGPALTARTVSNLLNGVTIDRYVRINVLGVGKLINALGGIIVNVPKDMKYQDNSQHLYINLKAGRQHLNGNQALQLLRYRRDALGDIGRIQRQQIVMRALIEQSLNPVTLTRLPQILNVIKENIDTNLTLEEILTLLGFGARTDRSNMQMLMLPGYFSNPREYNASYWLPKHRKIPAMMSWYFRSESNKIPQITHPETLKIAIQNQTGSKNINFRPLIERLQKAGYSRIYFAKSFGLPLGMTRIVAQQGDRNSAKLVRNTLQLGEVRVESTGNLNSDVSIQVGQDYLE